MFTNSIPEQTVQHTVVTAGGIAGGVAVACANIPTTGSRKRDFSDRFDQEIAKTYRKATFSSPRRGYIGLDRATCNLANLL